MSLLSDYHLRQALGIGRDTEGAGQGGLRVEPYPPESRIQPASIDLTLGDEFRWYGKPDNEYYATGLIIEPYLQGLGLGLDMWSSKADQFLIRPGQFLLACTAETITVGAALASYVHGKSSIGRLGLAVQNAGYIDPGFNGQLTLELFNQSPYSIRLTAGMPICQIRLERLTSLAQRPYGYGVLGSRYQGQHGAVPSRFGIGRGVPDGSA